MKNPFSKENLDKEFLVLHLTDKKNNTKTYKIVKRQAYAAFTALTIFLSGCLYSYSYYRINTEKLVKTSKQLEETTQNLAELESEKKALEEKTQSLEVQNNTYDSQLVELKQKAEDIETKINDLNKAKQELYQKLEEVSHASKKETDENNEIAAVVSATETDSLSLKQNFMPLVITPYTVENTKIAVLSATLSQLEASVEEENTAYIDVSNDVTETLAFVASLPSIWPVAGQVSSEFSYRSDPINSSSAFHSGIDIRVPIGTPVYATAAGRVIAADSSKSGYGNRVEINHGNGYVTLYAHNSALNVSAGDWVEKGDIIAYSGATGRVTGPHCHYEVLLNGEYQNPRDFIK